MDEIGARMLVLKEEGYCCSQVLLILGLELLGRTNIDLVRSMAGLCHGTSRSGEVCGALSGAACLLSLYAAKGSDGEEADERLPQIFSELTSWFRRYVGTVYGGITCDAILAKCPDKSACGFIVRWTYQQIMDILQLNGFDPAKAKDGWV
ncbi:MAG TPA: hypothetical protein DDZ40_06980 [Deltaproteobacteria bacterium]|nr:hypothetical protein [Deltaproteobacteria bacterium]